MAIDTILCCFSIGTKKILVPFSLHWTIYPLLLEEAFYGMIDWIPNGRREEGRQFGNRFTLKLHFYQPESKHSDMKVTFKVHAKVPGQNVRILKGIKSLKFQFWRIFGSKNGKFFKIPNLKWWNFSIVKIVLKIAYILGPCFISGTFLELKCIFWILCIRGRGLRPIPESIKFGAKAISLVVCAENFFLNFDENIKNWIPTSHNKNHLLKKVTRFGEVE